MDSHNQIICLDVRSEAESVAQRLRPALLASGHAEESFEWRIMTTTERGIDAVESGYRVYATSYDTWQIEVANERAAFEALVAVARLQHAVFYVVGGSNFPAKAETRPRWKPEQGRNACERYVAALWHETGSRTGGLREDVSEAIAAGGGWRDDTAEMRLVPSPYEDDASTWYRLSLCSGNVRFDAESPTCFRACELRLLYGRIAAALQARFGSPL